MKSVGLLPVNLRDAQDYQIKESPLFNQDLYEYYKGKDMQDQYQYLLDEGVKKGVTFSDEDWQDLRSGDERALRFYQKIAADDKEEKDWNLGKNENGEDEIFHGTEKDYYGKIIDNVIEYNKYQDKLMEEKMRKDAMNGFQKFLNGTGAVLGNAWLDLEQLASGLLNFVGNGVQLLWGDTKYDTADFGWGENVRKRQAELADWERRATDFRDVMTGETTTLGEWTLGLTHGVANMLPAMVMNYFVPGSGMYVMYGGSAINTFDSYMRTGNYNGWQVAANVAISTAFEILIEKGLNKLTGGSKVDELLFGKGKVAKEVGKDAVVEITKKNGQKIALNWLKEAGMSMLHEGMEEYFQEWSNIIVDALSGLVMDKQFYADFQDENGNFIGMDKLCERTMQAGVIGAILSPVMGGFGKIISGQIVTDVKTIFGKEYVVTENGKTRQIGFYEKIAMQTDLRNFAKMAQHPESLSTEQREQLYKSALILGQFMQGSTSEDLQKCFKLVNDINAYAKEQAAKQEKINEAESEANKKDLKKIDTKITKLSKEIQKQTDIKPDNNVDMTSEYNKMYVHMLSMSLENSYYEARNKVLEAKVEAKEAKKAAKQKAKEAEKAKKEKLAHLFDTKEETKKKAVKGAAKELKDANTTSLEELENLLFGDEKSKKQASEYAVEVEKNGKIVIPCDASKIVNTADAVFVPKAYLQNGDLQGVLRAEVQDDVSKKFVEFLKEDSRRNIMWEEAKVAMLRAYPQWKVSISDDITIAKNILFEANGATQLLARLDAQVFNSFVKEVIRSADAWADMYKDTRLHKATVDGEIKTLRENFRQAAIRYCYQNFGVIAASGPMEFGEVLSVEDKKFLVDNAPRNWKVYPAKPGTSTWVSSKVQEVYNRAARVNEDVREVADNLTKKKSIQDLPDNNPLKRALTDKGFFERVAKGNLNEDDALLVREIENMRNDLLNAQWDTPDGVFQCANISFAQRIAIEKAVTGDVIDVPGMLMGDQSLMPDKKDQYISATGREIFIQEPAKKASGMPIGNGAWLTSKLFGMNQKYVCVFKSASAMVLQPVTGDMNYNGDNVPWNDKFERLEDGRMQVASLTGNKVYDKKGKEYKFDMFLKKSLSPLTKAATDLYQVIHHPETYLNDECIAQISDYFGSLSPTNVYLFLRDSIMDLTDGMYSLTVDVEGQSYQITNLIPTAKFVKPEIKKQFSNKTTLTDTERTTTVDEFFNLSNLPATLKGVKIVLQEGAIEGQSAGCQGVHRSQDNTIIVRTVDVQTGQRITNARFLQVLTHEFQHAIQHAFDWAATAPGQNYVIPEGLCNWMLKQPQWNKRLERAAARDPRVRSFLIEEECGRIIYEESNEIMANQTGDAQGLNYFPFLFTRGKIIAPNGVEWVVQEKENEQERLKRQQKRLDDILGLMRSPFDAEYIAPGYLDTLTPEEKNRLRSVDAQKAKDNYVINKYYYQPKRALGKPVHLSVELQGFLMDLKNEEGLKQLEPELAKRIRAGESLTYNDIKAWFKEATSVNEYTFKLLRENFFPDSKINSMEELEEISTKLAYAIDENGNIKVDSRGRPIENKYKNRGEEFSINYQKYRVALMKHYDPSKPLTDMQKYIRQTEFKSRTVANTDMKADDDDSRDIGSTKTLEDQVYEKDEGLKKENKLKAVLGMKLIEAYGEGKCSKEEFERLRDDLKRDDYFDGLTEAQFNAYYKKHMTAEAARKMTRAGEQIATGEKTAEQRRREKNTRGDLRKIGSMLSWMTIDELEKAIGKEDASLFKRDEDGNFVYAIGYQLEHGKRLMQDTQAEREALVNRLMPIAKKAAYSRATRYEAYKTAKALKAKTEKPQNRVEVKAEQTKSVNQKYALKMKINGREIGFNGTRDMVPDGFRQLLKVNVGSNMNYSPKSGQDFLRQNFTTIQSLSDKDWLETIEFMEQMDSDSEDYKKIRLYTLSAMVGMMQIGALTLDKNFVARANNIMSKGTDQEQGAWEVIQERVVNKLLPEAYYCSEGTMDKIRKALVTNDDKALEDAAVSARMEIEENFKQKGTWNKVLAFRYSAMLSSPLTWLRNIISNRIVKVLNKGASVLGEKVFGHKIEVKDDNYKLTGTQIPLEIKQWMDEKLVQSGFLKELTNGYSKYDPYRKMEDEMGVDYIVNTFLGNMERAYQLEHTFKTPLLNKFHTFVTKMVSDEKYINEATLRYFGKMITEDLERGKITQRDLKKGMFTKSIVDIFSNAQWLAFTDYMRSGNFVTKWLGELNQGGFFAKYAIPLVAPFAQSSINWWMESLRYTPLGLGKSIIDLVKYDKHVMKLEEKRGKTGEIVQPKAFDRYLALRNLGKGIIGTGLWVLGGILNCMGVIGLQRNKDDKYVLKLGSQIELDVSKFFGTSSLLAGAATVEACKEFAKSENKSLTKVIGKILNQYAESLFISDILSDFRYSGSLGEYFAELPQNFLYSMVPNMMKLVAQEVHPYKVRYASGFRGVMQRLAGSAIPGLAYTFEAYVDPYTGKRMSNGRVPILGGAIGLNYYDISPQEKEAMKHGIKIGNLDGKISVNGKQHSLNRQNMNTYAGQYTEEYLTLLMDDKLIYNKKRYSRMSEEEKKAAFNHYINQARSEAKIQVWTEAGHKYYANEELYRTLKSRGINNVYLGSRGYVE